METLLRDGRAAAAISQDIAELTAAAQQKLGKETIKLMEVCGSHTVAIFRSGIRDLLPEGLRLVSGPGCPVCVTAIADVDRAIAVSTLPDVIFTTFGDMLRVPGSRRSLQDARAEGADVRVVYSPLDALVAARKQPDKKVVFFAAGFETTAPTVAAAVLQAEHEGLDNFLVHSVHKIIPPAMRALLSSPEIGIDGFICPGHVSTIIGPQAYNFIADEYGKPAVIAGFEPLDILIAIKMILGQLESGSIKVESEYGRVVNGDGNLRARKILMRVFEAEDAEWRGIGVIPGSGLRLNKQFAHRAAFSVLGQEIEAALANGGSPESADGAGPATSAACECGEVLLGLKIPTECKLFGRSCTPERPLGACMVSSEGSCSAYYRFSPSVV